jgi:anaerobic magnesium-protoporphyrin IX monomethyl ester cyclase
MHGAVDLVLINPNSRMRVYQCLGKELAAVEPPVWAGLMASFVRRHGYRVALIDAEAEQLSPEDTAQRAADLLPRLVAIVVYGHQPSASTQVMPSARETALALRESLPAVPRAMVGGHVAALPQRTLTEEPVDYVAGGEGLYTLVDLLEALSTPVPRLDAVRDLWYRDDGIRRGPAAQLMNDLEKNLPGIAWDLLPMERYRAHNWHCLGESTRQPYAALYTSLGCPFRCTFCCIQAPFKSGESASGLSRTANSYRLWSPEFIVEQLRMLVERYGVRHVKIADEMFVLHRRHVEGVCRAIIREGLDLNLWGYARIDTVRDGMLPLLREAGFRWLAFGIESASARVRADVEKNFAQDEVYRILEQTRREGIHVIGNYIFGLPEDDLSTMTETLDLAMDLKCEFANFYTAMAYPGSPLYQQARLEGWPLPNCWGGYSQHAIDTQPLPTRYLAAEEVLRFRDEAFQKYFSSSGYLERIAQTFGPEAVEGIRRMTAHRLQRRLYQVASACA